MRLVRVLPIVLAAALVTAVAGPASAATGAAAGKGEALSGGSLVQLQAAGQVLEALRLQLPTSTTGTPSALARVTPLLRGDQPVVPPLELAAGQTRELPAQTAGLPGVLELTSPTGSLSAAVGADGPVSSLTAGVGSLRLLGVDVLGDGSFAATSGVTGLGAVGTKRLVLDGLALPTLADLLAGLGLDLAKLPVGTLLDLLRELRLLDVSVLDDLQDLVASLGLTTVDDLVTVLDGELAPAQLSTLLDEAGAPAEVESAATALTTAIAGLTAELPSTGASGVTASALLPGVGGLPVLGPIVDPVAGGSGGTGDNGTDVIGGVLDPILDMLPADLVADITDDLEAVLADPTDTDALLRLVESLTGALVELVLDLLDTVLSGDLADVADLPALLDVPLLEVGALELITVARSGSDEQADVSGTVQGLEVLGTDVLDELLGSSTADLTALLGGGVLADVQGVLDDTLGAVTDVLGEVSGLHLPLPEVEVLRVVEEQLSSSAGSSTARAGVEALSLTWALSELRIPAAVSTVVGGVTGGLPVSLPVGGLQASALPTDQLAALLSQDLSLVVGDLTDTSAFTAAAAVPPTTGTPGTAAPGTPPAVITPAPVRQLPRTGATALAAVAGLALLGTAALLRRRREAPDAEL